MRIDWRQRTVGGTWGIQAAGRKFEHAYNLFPCHVEPLHDFLDTCPGFEVLENGGNRHTGVPKNPRAADLAGDALHGGALRPIEIRHSRASSLQNSASRRRAQKAAPATRIQPSSLRLSAV